MNGFKIAVIFLFLFKVNFSQSIFVAPGSYYNYNFVSHDGGTTGIKTLYYTSDTIISTVSYKKICTAINYHCSCPDPPIYSSYCNEYLLERNDSLFRYIVSTDTLQCLYTFNSIVGDSIVFDSAPTNPNFRYKIVLDSIGSLFICGINRPAMYYTKYQDMCLTTSTPVTIVKGIGPIDDYLFSQTNGCDLGIGIYTFNCVNTGDCNYPSSVCANVPLKLNEFSGSNPNIFISYTPNGIQLSFQKPLNGSVIILNTTGAVIFNEKLINQSNFHFPTTQLTKGIYLISITPDNSGEVFAQKFVRE